MMEMENLYARPMENIDFLDCDFYHTIDVPEHGIINGQWDLRENINDYLGNYTFSGKRVLEIGPASGFITIEMEKQGASVVSLEVTDDPGWDFVPYPIERLDKILESRKIHMNRIKKSYWFVHKKFNSNAKLLYGNSSEIPENLGNFDVAIMASVLLHCERPLRIISECAKRAKTLIVTERYRPYLEGMPIIRLVPTNENFTWDTWYEFSTDFFRQYFNTLGFNNIYIRYHQQKFCANQKTQMIPFFTIIGSKVPLEQKNVSYSSNFKKFSFIEYLRRIKYLLLARKLLF